MGIIIVRLSSLILIVSLATYDGSGRESKVVSTVIKIANQSLIRKVEIDNSSIILDKSATIGGVTKSEADVDCSYE